MAASRPLRVLVVDDNTDSVNTLSMLLDLTGHTVRSATDAESALAIAAEFHPEVGIFDVGMPGTDGYDLARHVRNTPWGRAMCLIALTGWGTEEDKGDAAAAGFDHHITKPVDLELLQKYFSEVEKGEA